MYVWHTQRERTDEYFLMESYMHTGHAGRVMLLKREKKTSIVKIKI